MNHFRKQYASWSISWSDLSVSSPSDRKTATPSPVPVDSKADIWSGGHRPMRCLPPCPDSRSRMRQTPPLPQPPLTPRLTDLAGPILEFRRHNPPATWIPLHATCVDSFRSGRGPTLIRVDRTSVSPKTAATLQASLKSGLQARTMLYRWNRWDHQNYPIHQNRWNHRKTSLGLASVNLVPIRKWVLSSLPVSMIQNPFSNFS